MRDDSITIPPFVAKMVESIGVNLEDLMRSVGASTTPRDGRVTINTSQFFALWNAVAASGVPPEFGLKLPLSAPSHHFDVASTSALLSPTFGEALTRLARYKRLTCPEDIEVSLVDKEAQVRFIWLCATASIPTFVVDAAFSWLCRLAEIGSAGVVKPTRIEVSRTESSKELLTRHFGCEVKFNAPRDILIFDKGALDTRFTSHHPQMLELMIPGLEAALRERSTTQTLTERVRILLVKSMHGRRPSVDVVAKELCVSARTLQRKLEDEGTSYQRILDDVRQETARHLLASTDLDTGEIAFVLGFEELNSFTRAFQGWEGTSPSRWRSTKTHSGVQRPLQ